MLNRDQFSRLRRSSYENIDNLRGAGLLPLAFGLTVPAAHGEYHPADVVAGALADALVARRFPRETAVRVVSELFEIWWAALSDAEWQLHGASFDARGKRVAEWGFSYFAVARIRRGKGKTDVFRAAAGPHDRALNEVRQAGPIGLVEDIALVGMDDVLEGVREAFYENDLIDALDGRMFTRPRGHPEFERWKAEVDDYRRRSREREQAREEKQQRAARRAKTLA